MHPYSLLGSRDGIRYMIPTTIPNPTRVAPSDRGLERHGGGWGCGREGAHDVDASVNGDWVVCLVVRDSM